VANVNRDPKKGRAFKPADFDPYAERPKARPAEESETAFRLLKLIFVDQGRRENP
jgi:hypothetical protein